MIGKGKNKQIIMIRKFINVLYVKIKEFNFIYNNIFLKNIRKMLIIRISKKNSEVSCKKFLLKKKDKFTFKLPVEIGDKIILKLS